MTRTMFLVTPHDTVNQVFILKKINESGKLVVKEEYGDLVCKKCRKVDEKAAIARGLPEQIVVKSKRPFILSSDFFYLVDANSEQLLQSIAPNLIDFIPIPTTHFFVASPKLCLQPTEGDIGYRFGDGRCVECHRPREVVWGKVPPRVSDVPRLFSVNLEGQLGARAVWLVSGELAAELRRLKSRLTGMVIRPKDVDEHERN